MTANPYSASPPARSAAETTARILAAAEALFARHGYDAVSMNAIAEQAGVSKANLFHHFGSKENLYVSVLNTVCRDATERLDSLERGSEPLPKRLERFAAEHIQDLIDHADVTRLILRELLKDGPRQSEELAANVFGDKFARLVAILREAQNRGELHADFDPAIAASALIGANVSFFQTAGLLRHFPDAGFASDPARYARAVVGMLLKGIAGEPATPEPPSRNPTA